MNTPPASALYRWWRLAALGWVILFFIWLPLEDLDVAWVLLLAAGFCLLAAARVTISSAFQRLARTDTGSVLVLPVAGALAGLAVSPFAVFLMLLKSGLHGHAAPDFTPDQVFAVLLRSPFWVAGGLLLGLGFALWRKVKSA